MSPVSFIQQPIRWLRAISRYKATHSGGPNFAYDLCARKITPEQHTTLDLSSWCVAFDGAEPIRKDTLERFAEAFEPCGFRRSALYPCYGLAEATLKVSGGPKKDLPVFCTVQEAALEQNRVVETSEVQQRVRTLVGLGRSAPDAKIVIVDSESLTQCEPGQVGEIWVSGPSIARGYWKRPEETEQIFRAHLADTGEGPFLRTGDLGFLKDGELFFTGRQKDLIIIRGQNHYPQDIELTVERSHPSLRPGCGAAFSVDVAGEERLVVVAEVNRRYQPQGSVPLDVLAVVGAIRQAVAERHELQVHAVLLLESGSVPKTSSGKIQRQACKNDFLAGRLDLVGEWRGGTQPARDNPDVSAEPDYREPGGSPRARPSAEVIRSWLIAELAARLGMDPSAIDVCQPFAHYGLDSKEAVGLAGDLENRFDLSLPATLAWDYPTIDSLARHLAGEPVVSASPSRVSEDRGSAGDLIAIIGIGCRLPGAADPEALWRLLRDGVDAITEVPTDRWDVDAFYDPDPAVPGKMNTRWGGFLEHLDQFDPHFFGIAPREAIHMDPQQRLLLEVAWEALEDAGQVPERLIDTRTGVFIGISTNDYGSIQMSDPTAIDAYAGSGSAMSIAANRLSYLLDLRGPSMAIDTACSSSLVAVHVACQSLMTGESSLALAGGVNVILSPGAAINFTKVGVMAQDGRCKTFDARANGYVRSEGAGVVVLKPLSRALADGDPIYAVIRGSAVNQDGRTNGILAPSRWSQESLLRDAYRRAGVSPGQVQYVEAHGTGTFLGDPIEAQALGTVLGTDRPAGSRCAIGSVKSNIGHLESAAGVAGLIKVALMLKHQMIPASLHFQEPNPEIPFDELPLRVAQTLKPWPEEPRPSLAGVSSFGFGGTNAHVVVEEAPPIPEAHPHSEDPAPGQAYLLPLSARSPEALRALAVAYRDFLAAAASGAGSSLQDVCYTASARRGHHDFRLAIVGHACEELVEQLETFLQEDGGTAIPRVREPQGPRRKLVFVFPGQGPKWWPLDGELLEREPVFRESLEHCDQLLSQQTDWSLLGELTADEAETRLNETDVVQPALFAVQAALAALWLSWGIEPDAVVGHSMGEVTAAHVAGALTLEDALKVVLDRGRLIKRVAGQGKMAVVELSLEQAQSALAGYQDRLSIAASNGPTSTVLSGEPAALEEVLTSLERKDVFSRLLASVDFASHSPQMEPLQNEFERALEGLQPQPSSVPIYSTVTGLVSDGLAFGSHYWARNLREPVLFSTALGQLLDDGHDIFLELSPHPVLLAAVSQCFHQRGEEKSALPSLRRGEDGRAAMLGSLGALYTLGYPVDWSRLYPSGGECVRLPS
jgi:acyl transferase domain-containing protein/acyl carrier protein